MKAIIEIKMYNGQLEVTVKGSKDNVINMVALSLHANPEFKKIIDMAIISAVVNSKELQEIIKDSLPLNKSEN